MSSQPTIKIEMDQQEAFALWENPDTPEGVRGAISQALSLLGIQSGTVVLETWAPGRSRQRKSVTVPVSAYVQEGWEAVMIPEGQKYRRVEVRF